MLWRRFLGKRHMLAISITSAGVEESILTWGNDMIDIEKLQVFTERVLPKA